MSESGAGDVFLSYSSRDGLEVQRLSVELVARGVRCDGTPWYSRLGDDWTLTLRRALESVQAVALVLGPGELSSWQQRERAWALARLASGAADFVLIPVLLPGATPPAGLLQQLPWVDLRPTDPGTVRLSQAEEQRRLDVLAGLLRREQLESSEPPVLVPSPYRGRQHFREEDAAMFFGRDIYAAHLHRLIRQHRMVAVTGPAGCGKSSLVRAGLLPQLRMSGDGEVWEIVTMVPGVEPLRSLAAAFRPLLTTQLAHTEDGDAETRQLSERFVHGELRLGDLVRLVLQQQPGTTRLLLYVDQWEDLYKHGKSSADCDRLIQEILEEVREPGTRLRVIFTIRWDFYGEVLKHRQLLDALIDARVELGPLNAAELHEVIQLSAEKGGLRFEPGLVERIVADADANPANLAVLGFILDRLWQMTAPERLVTSSAYSAVGNMVLAAAARVAGEAHEAGAKDCMKRGLREFVDRYLVRRKVQWLIGTVLVCLWAAFRAYSQMVTLLMALLTAPGENVPAKLDDLEFYGRWTRGYLLDVIKRGSKPNERRNAALAMARFFPDEATLDLFPSVVADFNFDGPDRKNFETAVRELHEGLGSERFLQKALLLAREGDSTLVTEVLASAEPRRRPEGFPGMPPAEPEDPGRKTAQMSQRDYDDLLLMTPWDVKSPADRQSFLYVWCLLQPAAGQGSAYEDTEEVLNLYKTAADAGVQAAARWALLDMGRSSDELEDMVRDCGEADADAGKRNWFVTRPVSSREGAAASVKAAPGFTMVDIRRTQPPEFVVWLANREVSVAQFRAVCPERFGLGMRWPGGEDADPMRSVNWCEALIFCNRLSTAHGLPAYYDIDERDYDWKAGILKPDAKYPSIRVESGRGYRLPHSMEWLRACMAFSRVNFSFGRNPHRSSLFAIGNEELLARPQVECGARRPNRRGFSDMCGHVVEWCWDQYGTIPAKAGSDVRLLCGGWSRMAPLKTMVYHEGSLTESRDSGNGFRIARTRPDDTATDTEQPGLLSEPGR